MRLTADGVDSSCRSQPARRPRPTAGPALLDDAAATVDRLVARAPPDGRRADPPVAVPVPVPKPGHAIVVATALAELDPADERSVDAAVTLGRFASWLDRLDRLADRLPAG